MTTSFDAADVLAAQQRIRERLLGLLRSLDDEQAARIVPTCPDWTVTELTCHLYGVTDDIINGRLENAGSSEWTAAQVARHGSKSLADLCDEWEASADTFDPIMLAIPKPVNLQVVMDMATHEHDIRLAVGAPGAQDDVAVEIGSQYLLQGLANRDADLAAQIEDLDITEFERFRSLAGRRSLAQLEATGFPGEAYAATLARAPFSVTTIDIDERTHR